MMLHYMRMDIRRPLKGVKRQRNGFKSLHHRTEDVMDVPTGWTGGDSSAIKTVP